MPFGDTETPQVTHFGYLGIIFGACHFYINLNIDWFLHCFRNSFSPTKAVCGIPVTHLEIKNGQFLLLVLNETTADFIGKDLFISPLAY